MRYLRWRILVAIDLAQSVPCGIQNELGGVVAEEALACSGHSVSPSLVAPLSMALIARTHVDHTTRAVLLVVRRRGFVDDGPDILSLASNSLGRFEWILNHRRGREASKGWRRRSRIN